MLARASVAVRARVARHFSVYFTESHEWVRLDGNNATIGITDHAQEQLGEIVFVEPVETEIDVQKGDSTCQVESVKAVGSVYAPADGSITKFNDALEDEPELVNESPEESGWLFKMTVEDAESIKSDLMDEAAYKEFLTTVE
ncbi:MAG: hypothetical protein MHM6MM_002666 [Cercozoa sp. M6MM]